MVGRSITSIFAVLMTMAIGQTPRSELSSNRILVETYGNCAQVAVELSGAPSSVIVDGACHGWSVEQCDDQMLIRVRGVRIDAGNVIHSDGRRVDATANINAELGLEGDELLHLQFLQPACTANGFELPFTGSRIGIGAYGPADELSGTVRIDRHAAQVAITR